MGTAPHSTKLEGIKPVKAITSYTTVLFFPVTMLLSACATPNRGNIGIDWGNTQTHKETTKPTVSKKMVHLPTHLLMVIGPNILTDTTVTNTPIMTRIEIYIFISMAVVGELQLHYPATSNFLTILSLSS
jgi:hypothetical protein